MRARETERKKDYERKIKKESERVRARETER